MNDLMEFLRARLDEDERIALAADKNPIQILMARQGGKTQFAEFMGRHGPARVLADVAAKRAILDELTSYGEKRGDDEAAEWHREGHNYARFKVVRLLALPYADHPEYREEWRP